MTTAIRTVDGQFLLVAEGSFAPRSLDLVDVHLLTGRLVRGEVVIEPHLLLTPGEAQGEVVALECRDEDPESPSDNVLPGTEMPPLWSVVRRGDRQGRVVKLHHEKRGVTVRSDDGSECVVSID